MSPQWSGGCCSSSKVVNFIGNKRAFPLCLYLLKSMTEVCENQQFRWRAGLRTPFLKCLSVSGLPMVNQSPVLTTCTWWLMRAPGPLAAHQISSSCWPLRGFGNKLAGAGWRPQEAYKHPQLLWRGRICASFPNAPCPLLPPLQAQNGWQVAEKRQGRNDAQPQVDRNRFRNWDPLKSPNLHNSL